MRWSVFLSQLEVWVWSCVPICVDWFGPHDFVATMLGRLSLSREVGETVDDGLTNGGSFMGADVEVLVELDPPENSLNQGEKE